MLFSAVWSVIELFVKIAKIRALSGQFFPYAHISGRARIYPGNRVTLHNGSILKLKKHRKKQVYFLFGHKIKNISAPQRNAEEHLHIKQKTRFNQTNHTKFANMATWRAPFSCLLPDKNEIKRSLNRIKTKRVPSSQFYVQISEWNMSKIWVRS